MTSGPEQPSQPFRGVEYPSLENSPPPVEPYAPVDYPEGRSGTAGEWIAGDPGLPPPVYPTPPYPGTSAHPGYGYPAAPYDPYHRQKPPGTNGKAIAALVTALAGVLCCLPAIAGPILGIIAMRETRRTGQDGYGIALAGTIIGALVIAFWSLYFVVVIGVAATGWQYAP
jgi:Domain of unknown function (DUF4190)